MKEKNEYMDLVNLFDIDEETCKKLEIASRILDIDLKEEFDDWVQSILRCAANELSSFSYEQPKRNQMNFLVEKNDGISTDTLKERIERWKNKPDNVNYQMIKSFFIAEEKMSNDKKGDFRESMFKEFVSLSPKNDDIDRFNRNLRAMSSNASRAYGAVFKITRSSSIDQTKISLNPEIEHFVRSKKEEFTK